MSKLGKLISFAVIFTVTFGASMFAWAEDEGVNPPEYPSDNEREDDQLSLWMVEGEGLHSVVMPQLETLEEFQVAETHWQLVTHAIFNSLVVENGLVVVLEDKMPGWINPEHLKYGVAQLNEHIANTIGYVTTASDLLDALESFHPPKFAMKAQDLIPMPMSEKEAVLVIGDEAEPIGTQDVIEEGFQKISIDEIGPIGAARPSGGNAGPIGAAGGLPQGECFWGVSKPFLCLDNEICGYSAGDCSVLGGDHTAAWSVSTYLERQYCPIEWVPGVPWNPCFAYDVDSSHHVDFGPTFSWTGDESLVHACARSGKYRTTAATCLTFRGGSGCIYKQSKWVSYGD